MRLLILTEAVTVVLLLLLPGLASAESPECTALDEILTSLDDDELAQVRRQISLGRLEGFSRDSGECVVANGHPPCGIEDGEKGCSDFATAGYGSESFAGHLLGDLDRPLTPLFGRGPACYSFSGQCSALPSFGGRTLTASRQISPDLPGVPTLPKSSPERRWTTAPWHSGLGPARGFSDEIDHPPRT